MASPPYASQAPIAARDAILIESSDKAVLLETSAVRAIGTAAPMGAGFASRVEIHVAGLSSPFTLDFSTAAEAEERAFGIATACGFAPLAAQRLRRVR